MDYDKNPVTMIHPDNSDMHNNPERSKTCRVCSSAYTDKSNSRRLGICDKCGYKILIMFVALLVVVSYMVWFGVF
jgi:DNA-directed RNA polymerase subunit RPC12/RpoP